MNQTSKFTTQQKKAWERLSTLTALCPLTLSSLSWRKVLLSTGSPWRRELRLPPSIPSSLLRLSFFSVIFPTSTRSFAPLRRYYPPLRRSYLCQEKTSAHPPPPVDRFQPSSIALNPGSTTFLKILDLIFLKLDLSSSGSLSHRFAPPPWSRVPLLPTTTSYAIIQPLRANAWLTRAREWISLSGASPTRTDAFSVRPRLHSVFGRFWCFPTSPRQAPSARVPHAPTGAPPCLCLRF